MSSYIDVGNDTSAEELQTLINEAEAGSTLRLAAGTFEFDDAITIERSDISLIGAGSEQTTVRFNDEALERNDDHAIHLNGTENTDQGELESAMSEGDQSLALDRDHDLQVGDTIRLSQDNDDAFFDEIGDTSWRKVEHADLRTSMAKVASVDGDSVTLDRGVHFDFEGGKTQVERLSTVNDVSLGGFSVEFDLGTAEAGDFDSPMHELTGYHAVSLEGTVDAQLNDITVNDGPSHAFYFSKTLDTNVEDIAAHGAINKGSGGNGYAFELHESYNGSFSGLEDTGMRHGLVFASWRSSVGNDVEVAYTDRDVNFHGGRDHDNSVRVLESVRDPDADTMSPAVWTNSGGESFGAITDAEANDVIFDYMVGSRRSDDVQGSDDGVYLNGNLGDDTLTGGAGNDILQGGPGDDWIDGTDRLDGGDGIDTARYVGDYADHQVALNAKGAEITGKGSHDSLTNMEFAVFGDGSTLHMASGNVFSGEPLATPDASSILNGDAELPGLVEDGTELLATSNTTSSWSSGYVAEVFIENVSDDEIVNPEVQFDLSADIDTLWNGSLTEDDGTYRVEDNSDNTLAPGEAWRFSFKAYGDDQSLPDEMTASNDNGNGIDVQLLGMADQVDDLAG
ncbi:cellulose binding domain-containing protein [Onishia niordana]|uniref:cellulose binding domain-containing protein n=1 Tax=Onishia niordana TaxID=2508711 RepID=UPI0010A0BA2B|nr:cellulose binding domain-containing protein [Halomonas niordiana]